MEGLLSGEQYCLKVCTGNNRPAPTSPPAFHFISFFILKKWKDFKGFLCLFYMWDLTEKSVWYFNLKASIHAGTLRGEYWY